MTTESLAPEFRLARHRALFNACLSAWVSSKLIAVRDAAALRYGQGTFAFHEADHPRRRKPILDALSSELPTLLAALSANDGSGTAGGDPGSGGDRESGRGEAGAPEQHKPDPGQRGFFSRQLNGEFSAAMRYRLADEFNQAFYAAAFDEALHPRSGDGKFSTAVGGHLSTTIGDKPVLFVRHPHAQPRETTVMVDAEKLDKAWGHDQIGYIPRGGGGAEIEGRRADFESFLGKHRPVEASRIHIDKEGKVSFADGRHRFSVLRDKGAKQMAVTISRSHRSRAERFLSAEPQGDLVSAFDKAFSGKDPP